MKKFIRNRNRFFCLILAAISAVSCASLKPYDRVYVNDPEMDLGNDAGKNFENYVHSIREGATPAGNSKGSGGCGCN
ncbi:MAG TPA: DUF4266 domain-containing protein [Catalimonadaceae bacterium]|nr:DUF4266 domain-containing protein [Catalimonadaceae bacterium]